MAERNDNAPAAATTLSFVVPLHDEQEGLEAFHARLSKVVGELGEPYEVVYVNDGSTDRTGELLRRLVEADERVRVVEFSRNYGHQVALTAGYDHAGGRAVISLDGDGQHPPEMIPQLLARWREGFEVVYTVRRDTEGISPVRRAVGRAVYRVLHLATGMELTDQADFRLLDRAVVDALRDHREQGRFLRGLVKHVGFRQTGLAYTAERRMAGRSSYSLRQLARMSTAGLFNFSSAPLRAAPAVGALMLALALLYLPIAIILWAAGVAPPGGVSLGMLLVGLFGLQFLFLGVLGEYLVRVFEEAKGRPLYVVRERLGFARVPEPATPEAQPETEEGGEQGLRIYT